MDYGNGNTINVPYDLSGLVKFDGSNNTIVIGRDATLRGAIWITGDNNYVELGEACILNGNISIIRGTNCNVRIGARTSIEVDTVLHCQETADITIGDDCMISSKCFITISDMHPIFDRTSKQRVNPAASITLGDRVWLGLEAYVSKGTTIGSGSVIGARSVATGMIPENVIAAGSPARVLRQDIEWDRDFDRLPVETPPVVDQVVVPQVRHKPKAKWQAIETYLRNFFTSSERMIGGRTLL